MHYGVIGMKWGMRRARKKGTEYTYKSHGQKKWEKKYNKKLKKNEKRLSENKKALSTEKEKYKLDTFKARDELRQDYVKRTSVGKSFVKTLTMGPIGNGSYNRYRAAGNTRLASFLKSNIVVSTLGAPVNILLSRAAEFKSAENIRITRKG